MRQSYFLLLFCLGHFSAFCQVNEYFSDSDFTHNPVWQGDILNFKISADSQLQSNGPNSAAQLYLSTQNRRCRDTEWNFQVTLDFDVTTSNWGRVYLTSDRSATTGFPKGYYIKFDGTSNSIDLYKQDSITHTKLIAGQPNRIGKTALNKMGVKVICDVEGKWSVYSDSMALGNTYKQEGICTDTSFNTSLYCGVLFSHSSTRRDKFYFDNFTVTQAPLSILSASAISSTGIQLSFSRPIDAASTTVAQFQISPSHVILSSVLHPNGSKITLSLSSPLTSNTGYSIVVTGLKDQEQNDIGFLNSASFSYRPETIVYDLIFSEFVADPSPPVGLPEVEFVELYNRRNDTIELQGFTFSDGSTTGIFPFYKLPPHEYVVICPTSNKALFQAGIPVIGLAIFPTLNNSADKLILKNNKGLTLHEVNYKDTWYGDNDKKNGGWSLELIDTHNPCAGQENWSASVASEGGTPGKQNSIYALKPDVVAPALLSAYLLNDSTIFLSFNEPLDTLFILPLQFRLESNTVKQVYPRSTELYIIVGQKIREGSNLFLSFSGLRDCNGNKVNSIERVELIMPEKAQPGDICLNELLFNPKSGGSDFVELYNRSSKYINLQHWQLANLKERFSVSKLPLILKPKEYIVFTEDKNMLLNHYPFGKEEAIFQLPSLPSLNDDEGTLLLSDSNGVEQERFTYAEEMHFQLIDNKEGVSLERVMDTESSLVSDNWHSASSTVGYATPGYRNSQSITKGSGISFWVEPKIFTPDQDGVHDFMLLYYNVTQPGYMANVTIFDYSGREILKFVRNELLSREGFYKWEGVDEKGERVRSGLYVLSCELFTLSGERLHIKETVVVGWGKE